MFTLAVLSNKNVNIITAITEPIEQKATKPKLFSFAFFVLKMVAIPVPKAIMKGTVIGPVVTPPLSNERGI